MDPPDRAAPENDAALMSRPELSPTSEFARGMSLVVLGFIAASAAAWTLLHVGWYVQMPATVGDVPIYENYGNRIVHGEMPYADFRVEYPPLALPAFAVPALLSHDSDSYRNSFQDLMAECELLVILVAGVALFGVRAPPHRFAAALAFAALSPLLLGSVVLTRFDLLPAALTIGGLAALIHGRPRVGVFVLGCAIAAKLWPAVLLPLIAAWLLRRYGRREAVVGAGIAIGVPLLAYAPFFVQSPGGVLWSLKEQLERPLQVESLGSGVLLALHQAVGMPLGVGTSHGSENLTGSAAGVIAVVLSVAQVAVLIWLWRHFAHGPAEPERLLCYAAACVVAFVALGKVLSPQFLIWLLPLVPLVRGRRGLAASALLGLACVLTQLWYPYRYVKLVDDFDPLASWLVLARDVLLLALLAVLVMRHPSLNDRQPRPHLRVDAGGPPAPTRASAPSSSSSSSA